MSESFDELCRAYSYGFLTCEQLLDKLQELKKEREQWAGV